MLRCAIFEPICGPTGLRRLPPGSQFPALLLRRTASTPPPLLRACATGTRPPPARYPPPPSQRRWGAAARPECGLRQPRHASASDSASMAAAPRLTKVRAWAREGLDGGRAGAAGRHALNQRAAADRPGARPGGQPGPARGPAGGRAVAMRDARAPALARLARCMRVDGADQGEAKPRVPRSTACGMLDGMRRRQDALTPLPRSASMRVGVVADVRHRRGRAAGGECCGHGVVLLRRKRWGWWAHLIPPEMCMESL